jgi:aldehyde decarbonylase
LAWEREAINDLIENAILEADKRGVKVLSLGLLNQVK